MGFIASFGIIKIGIAIVVAVVLGYIGVLKYENSSLIEDVAYEKKNNALWKDKFNRSAEIANSNANELERAAIAFNEQMRAVESHHKEELEKAKEFQIIKERIGYEEDAPVANVLSATFNGLRESQRPTTTDN